jgi:hypothetical protein
MPKEKAMIKYVEELKKIVETMSYTDNVANFMGSITELENVNVSDLNMVAPEAIKKVRSRSNSPLASRDTSPVRTVPNGVISKSELQNIPSISQAATLVNGYHQQNGHASESDMSDDEYIDIVDDSETDENYQPMEPQNIARRLSVQGGINPDVAAQIIRTIDRMNVDILQINNRINVVERALSEVRTASKRVIDQQRALDRYPNWWPFTEISPKLFVFVVLWPILAYRLMAILDRRRRS